MKEYIAELSKYMITLLLAVYALESFLSFRFSKKAALNGICFRQRVYLLLIQFLAFFTMTVRAHDMQYLFFYAYVQVFLFALMSVTGLIYEKADKLLLNNMCMLLGIGFIILARISLKKAEKQLAVALLSFLIALAVSGKTTALFEKGGMAVRGDWRGNALCRADSGRTDLWGEDFLYRSGNHVPAIGACKAFVCVLSCRGAL